MKKTILTAALVATVMLCSACAETEVPSQSSASEEQTVIDKMTEQDAVEYYTDLISKSYEDEIQQIRCFDLNGSGSYACAAIVGKDNDGIISGKVLFADADKNTEILTNKGLYNMLQAAILENCAIIIAEEGYGGSGSVSHVWKVDSSGCSEVDFHTMMLKYISGADFTAHFSEFEPWHTYKRYYFYWDGNTFREYGGVRITEEQLSSVDGGKQAIQRITDGGFTISDIFYRANSIININYANGDMVDNMTLIYSNGSVTVDESDDGWYNGGSGNVGGSYGGAYAAASVPDIAVYPDNIPF